MGTISIEVPEFFLTWIHSTIPASQSTLNNLHQSFLNCSSGKASFESIVFALLISCRLGLIVHDQFAAYLTCNSLCESGNTKIGYSLFSEMSSLIICSDVTMHSSASWLEKFFNADSPFLCWFCHWLWAVCRPHGSEEHVLSGTGIDVIPKLSSTSFVKTSGPWGAAEVQGSYRKLE